MSVGETFGQQEHAKGIFIIAALYFRSILQAFALCLSALKPFKILICFGLDYVFTLERVIKRTSSRSSGVSPSVRSLLSNSRNVRRVRY